MSTRSREEWPYQLPKAKRVRAITRWEEGAQVALGGAAFTHWDVLRLLVAAAAITVLSGIAVAALHQDDAQATKEQHEPAECAAGRIAADAHLQELLRDHRSAIWCD
jgi:hypothetical protein